MKAAILSEFEAIDKTGDIDSIRSNYQSIPNLFDEFNVGNLNVAWDAHGSLKLLRQNNGRNWASSLGKLEYQTLVKSDFDQWHSEYLLPWTGGEDEYGKPDSMMDAEPTPTHRMVAPIMTELQVDEGGKSFLVKAAFDDETLVESFGAYREVFIKYDFIEGGEDNEVRLCVFVVVEVAR